MHYALAAGWAATLLGLALCSCSMSASVFACSTDAECPQGMCQPVGYCSFPDAQCPSGQRFGEFAHPDFANVCVDEPLASTGASAPGDAGGSPGGVDTVPPSESVGSAVTSSSPADTGMVSESADTMAGEGGVSESGPNPLNDDPTLIVWYEFESDPAMGVFDSGPHGLHGICIADNCPQLEEGIIGRAIHLDGDEDAIITDMPSRFDTPEEWTICAWLRRDEVANELRMAFSRQFGDAFRNTYEIYFHDWEGGGPVLLHLGVTGLDGNEERISTPDEPPVGEWFHVVGRWDGESISLWVDGALVSERMIEATLFDDHDLLIGVDQNENNPVSNHFNGSIDDLRIYGRALAGDEIGILADPNGTP